MAISTVNYVHCPNCGSLAQKRFYEKEGTTCPNKQIVDIECRVCDYFVVMCSRNANVLESYAPGTSVAILSRNPDFGLRKLDRYLEEYKYQPRLKQDAYG